MQSTAFTYTPQKFVGAFSFISSPSSHLKLTISLQAHQFLTSSLSVNSLPTDLQVTGSLIVCNRYNPFVSVRWFSYTSLELVSGF